MTTVAVVLAALVALIHVYIFVLESLLWTKPRGLRVFQMDAAKAETTRVLALNQGFYNLFIAIGIVWGLTSADRAPRTAIFLLTVAAAGVVGGVTVSKRILYVQTVPALLALLALFAAYR